MATKKETAVKETAVKPMMKYVLTFPDGTIVEGSTGLREFKPNIEKGFHNSGFQAKISEGNFNGSIMVVDYTLQKALARK